MSGRRTIRITREGWSFLSILGFIILGSIIQQINLLVLLSGLMIAPFFFNWRIAAKMLEHVGSDRELPDWVHAGEPFSAQWSFQNNRTRIPSWDIKLTEQIVRLPEQRGKRDDAQLMMANLEPRTTSHAAYRCLFGERGIYRFGKAQISCTFPLGLVRARKNVAPDEELCVAPRRGQLTRSWRHLMHSSAVGLRSSLMHRGSADDEFYALRPWRAGDSRRAIHWRSSAKRGELLVRQFDQRTEREFGLVLDLFNDGGVPASTTEYAISFFATALESMHQNVRSSVAVGVFGDTSRLEICRMSNHVIGDVMRILATIQPAAETGLPQSLNEKQALLPRDKPLIVISTRSMEHALRPGEPASPFLSCWIDVSTGQGKEYFQMNLEAPDVKSLVGLTKV